MKQLINAIRKGQGIKKLVFIHGSLASAKWWQPVMNALDTEFEMLAVDLKGFGDSPDASDQVTLADHAREIHDLAKATGFEQFIIIGHSLGGGVAMQFAADYPELLTGMVLVDSTPIGGIQGIDYSIIQRVVNNKELAMDMLKATLIKALDEGFLIELLADGVRAVPALIPNTRALEAGDFTAKAPDFYKPVLVIHGELDVLISAAESEKAASLYPHADFKVIPEVGHNPQVEAPDTFISILRDFVNKL